MPNDSAVGMNLSLVSYYGTEFPFIDRMKSAGAWVATGYDPLSIPLNQDGYPRGFPPGAQSIYTMIGLDPASAGTSKTYVLTYEGKADFTLLGATIVSREPGKITFQYGGGDSYMLLAVNALDSASPLNNMHVVRSDQLGLFAAGEIFNPAFTEKIAQFDTLRFMDWTNTNENSVHKWNDRTTMSDRTWESTGNSSVPIEVMVALANKTMTNMWLNVPTKADDDYVRHMMQYVHDNLNPSLSVKLEYSNEVWNWGFQQSGYAHLEAAKLWGKDANGDGVINPKDPAEQLPSGWVEYYGYRAAAVAKFANDIFADDTSRLQNVLATQTAYAGVEEYIMKGVARANVGKVSDLFDLYAITTYFGANLRGVTETDRSTILSWARSGEAGMAAAFAALKDSTGISGDGSLASLKALYTYQAAVAAKYGLELVAYEGGADFAALNFTSAADQQEVMSFFKRLQADPRMGDLYKQMVADFAAAGGVLANVLIDASPDFTHAMYGTLKSIYDVGSPAWNALIELQQAAESDVGRPVANGPIAIVGTLPTAIEQAAVGLHGAVSISDAGTGTAIVTATVSVGVGTITAGGGNGVTVTGSGTSSVVFSGTVAAINALLGAQGSGTFTFTAPGYAPPASTQLTVTVNQSGDTQIGTIPITAVNDAPLVDLNGIDKSATGTVLAYTENGAAIAIAPSASIADADSKNFEGGSLTVQFTAAGSASDQLTILNTGTVTTSGTVVRVGGVQIGTFTSTGTSLLFTFNAAATPATVGALIRNIGYWNTSDAPATSARTVSFTLVDGDGVANRGADTGIATATISVTATNDAPVARADAASTSKTAAVTVNVLANDSDVDGDALTVVSATASKGVATIVGTEVVFTPGAAFAGLKAGASETVLVSYTIADAQGVKTSSVLTVVVTGSNNAPIAVADTAAGLENQVLTVNVLANDTDADPNSVLTLAAAAAPAGKGFATVLNNQLVFTPGQDFDQLKAGATEVVNVAYTIEDDQRASASSTVKITVTGTNDAPVGVADVATTAKKTLLTFDVLANDLDVDVGHILSLSSAVAPAGKGTASIVNNQLVFTPGNDFALLQSGQSETVTVGYTLKDDQGATAPSTLTVTVTGFGTSAPPTATQQFHSVLPSAGAATVQGTGLVVGTVGGTQDVTVLNAPGQIQFDPSFNAGGDRIRLSGNASSYVVSRSGSTFVISDGDTVITVPIGAHGADIIFADGVRSVAFDTVSQSALLGGQVVTGTPSAITASAGPALATGAIDPDAVAQLISILGGTLTAAGRVTVLGTGSASETVYVLNGAQVTIDPSFNAGGDTIVLPNAASSYTVTRSGSSLTLVSATESLTVPFGIVGATLRFADSDLNLVFDLTASKLKLGGQTVSTTSAPLAAIDVPGHATMTSAFVTDMTSGVEHIMDKPLVAHDTTAIGTDFMTFAL